MSWLNYHKPNSFIACCLLSTCRFNSFFKFLENSFIILFESICSVPLPRFSSLETQFTGVLALYYISSITIIFMKYFRNIYLIIFI